LTNLELAKPNIIDRVINYFDPVRAYERKKARTFSAISGGYTGASYKRSLSQWSPFPTDADTAVIYDLSILRGRSRDLIRNSPIAAGAVNTAVTNVVGIGLKLQARPDRSILNFSEDEADAWEAKTETEFRLWAESQDSHMQRSLTFADIQDVAFRQVLENGDVFAVMGRSNRKFSPYSLAIQLIEADRVLNEGRTANSATLIEGVEKDENGAPKAYHICDQHPGNFLLGGQGLTWKIIPAFGEKTGLRNVIHLSRTLRPGQSRGVPYLAPVIETIKQLTRYTENEVTAAVVSAMFTVFLKTELGMSGIGLTSMDETGKAKASTDDLKLGNGMMVELRPGESIETANPGRPNSAFDPFIKAILEQVGVALEIPFEILIGHFSASYSASRAALQEAWRFFRGRRAWLARSFCQLIYENWLYEAVALGRIQAPGFFNDPLLRKGYSGALWIGEAPSQIDPMKEADAAEKRLMLGISTLDEETVMLTGGDFEANFPRIVKERAMMEKIGMGFQKKTAGSPQNQSMNQGETT
jgi:lambda family phage portal protein